MQPYEDEQEYIELSNFNGDSSALTDSPSNVGTSWNLTTDQMQLILLRLGVITDDNYSPGTFFDINIPPPQKFMIDKIDKMGITDAITVLREALAEHKDDFNFLHEDYLLIQRLVRLTPKDFDKEMNSETENKYGDEESEEIATNFKNKSYLNITDWNLQVRLEAALIAFHSPYPEIRSITDPFDNNDMPTETLRAYAIGLFWTLIGSIINNFFIHRLPSISLGLHTVQLLLLPSGRLWEKVVPLNKTISLFGQRVNLNPGPWSYKEMMLSTIIYLCSAGTPYLIYNIFVMKLDRFYGLKWVSWTFQLLLALSTQCLGFGFAGIMRKVCIYPVKSLWPTILPTIALNRALMHQEDQNAHSIHGWRISRYTFFYLVFGLSFIYNWIPSYFFTALSTFNWPTWINPYLVHLNNISGFKSGLGLNPLPSLDWNILDAAGCLTLPFYTYANQYLGSVLGFFVILIVYYTNNKWTGYLPINSNALYNNKGKVYDVHQILNEKNMFDNEKYQSYGPPYFTAANLVLYGAYFCLYPFAILFHVATEWPSMKASFLNIWNSIFDLSSKSNNFGRYSKDPHCMMMSKYKEVPDSWFLVILGISTTFAICCVLLYPTETPVWGIFFTIIINFVFLIPMTAIASVTGFSFGLNVLVELIVGYSIPNSGIALITLKSYGYNIDSQASNYITDQKLAHYTKIPPRAIFKGQLISTILSVMTALIIANWQLDNVQNICDAHQTERLSCPGANTYFFSSVQYGEIGPAKVFSGLYPVLKWCFLLGVLLVIPCYWFKNNGPARLTRYFHPTIIIGGFLMYAPYNLLYYTGGFYLSFIFMYYIKKNYLLWWEKYNYILTSALSAGVAFSALIIFFTVQSRTLDWWGNTISDQGIEGGVASRYSWLDVKDAEDGYIGLRTGHYP